MMQTGYLSIDARNRPYDSVLGQDFLQMVSVGLKIHVADIWKPDTGTVWGPQLQPSTSNTKLLVEIRAFEMLDRESKVLFRPRLSKPNHPYKSIGCWASCFSRRHKTKFKRCLSKDCKKICLWMGPSITIRSNTCSLGHIRRNSEKD